MILQEYSYNISKIPNDRILLEYLCSIWGGIIIIQQIKTEYHQQHKYVKLTPEFSESIDALYLEESVKSSPLILTQYYVSPCIFLKKFTIHLLQNSSCIVFALYLKQTISRRYKVSNGLF